MMSTGNSLHFETVRPNDLSVDEWTGLHDLYQIAFEDELILKRSAEEIDFLTRKDDFTNFYNSHIDPNHEVGKRFNDAQSFTRPLVNLAIDGNVVVGFGYSAHNVSGDTKLERTIKLLGNAKKYHWLREFVVHPVYQRNGVAKHLARGLLMHPQRSPFQPVTTYIWPDELPFLSSPLSKVGFEPTGEQEVHIYGDNNDPIRQVRMLAPNAAGVVFKLI